jgi:hypothetical protein
MLEHVGVPEPYHPAAMRFEPARSGRVLIHLFFFRVRIAIEFDNEFRRRAEEIREIRANRRLAAETEAHQLLLTKQKPQFPFAFGHPCTEFASARIAHHHPPSVQPLSHPAA